jgi:4-amino-4-deoxychorismate lyase
MTEPLFETIKIIGGEPQNLQLHDDRMNRSRRNLFGKHDLLKLADYITVPEDSRERTTKCRVIYSASVNSITFSPYIPGNITTLKIVDGGSMVYNYKYLDRTWITSLIDKSAADDILIVKKGNITDSSYANIVFTDGQHWFTPDTPLLYGTMREFLLRSGVIKEHRITINDIPHFTHFRLINAMLGFEAPLLPTANII